ncbi:MAG: hypothetical protein ACHQX3_00295 [Nitrospirales bacterium]
MLSIQAVVEAIQIPLDSWPGNCYTIAAAMHRADLVPGGLLRYGHYLGPVAAASIFHGRPLVPHGWIEAPDGSIVDPTRFVFEAREPYIYKGPNNQQYDAGGNVFRKQNEGEAPQPSGQEITLLVELPPRIKALLRNEGPNYTFSQLFWLANLSLFTLADDALDVYLALIDVDLAALIPIDNRRIVLGDEND